ncbi:MAG TPA: methyltransferase domain-containing protein [Allocoleopsis sp.]
MNTADRSLVYHDLHSHQLAQQDFQNRHSAQVILNILFRDFKPQSVLDVGCGLGTWLSVCQELGVQEIQGIEGTWLDTNLLKVPKSYVLNLELEQPFQLGRKFDLVICLEVAEHLDQKAAENFIQSLTTHSDIILFSAAIPYQGGHHHVNEQWVDYWNALFRKYGYGVVDLIRGQIWQDNSVIWWLRQNILLFVKTELIAQNEHWQAATKIKFPLSIVHPDVYQSKLKFAYTQNHEYQQLFNLLSLGGLFSVVKGDNGQISITKLSD